MKRILHTILLLLVDGVTFAQSYPRKCTEEDIPSSMHDKYFIEAKQFLNNYYSSILDLEDNVLKRFFIERNFADKSSITFCPESSLTYNPDIRLSASQYLAELDKTLKGHERESFEFKIDNVNCGSIMISSRISCYIPIEYDLTLLNNEKVIFKRRCKIYCLFPDSRNYMDVRVMQVDLVADLKNDLSIVEWLDFMVETMKKYDKGSGRDGEFYYRYGYSKVFNKEEGYKLIDKYGNNTTSTSWKSITSIANLAVAWNNDNKMEMLWPYRKEIPPYDMFDIWGYWDGIVQVKKNNLYGFVDLQLNEVIPCIYDDTYHTIVNGFCSVKKGDKWGFVDRKNRIIIPFEFDKIVCKAKYLACAKKDNQTFLIDLEKRKIKRIKDYDFYPVSMNSENFIKIGNSGFNYVGVINREGNEIIPLERKYTDILDDGRAYRYAIILSEGMMVVQRENKWWGYVNSKGKEIIPCIYEEAKPFSEGLAAVMKDDKWGFINKKGNVVIPFIYEEAHSFSGGIAAVYSDEGWCFINKKGKQISTEIYDSVEPFCEGLAATEKDGKWGYINNQLQVVIPFMFESADSFNKSEEAYVSYKSSKYNFLINTKGEVIHGPFDIIFK